MPNAETVRETSVLDPRVGFYGSTYLLEPVGARPLSTAEEALLASCHKRMTT